MFTFGSTNAKHKQVLMAYNIYDSNLVKKTIKIGFVIFFLFLSKHAYIRHRNKKSNIMPITQSIILLYRDAFPLFYQFAGCTCSNLAIMEASCPMKNAHGRLSQLSYLLHATPFYYCHNRKTSTFCYLIALRRICSFPSTYPVTDPQTVNISSISYVVFLFSIVGPHQPFGYL